MKVKEIAITCIRTRQPTYWTRGFCPNTDILSETVRDTFISRYSDIDLSRYNFWDKVELVYSCLDEVEDKWLK